MSLMYFPIVYVVLRMSCWVGQSSMNVPSSRSLPPFSLFCHCTSLSHMGICRCLSSSCCGVVLVVFIKNDDEQQPKSLFVIWLPHHCGRRGNWLGLVHGVGVWDGCWGLWVSWHCCVIVEVLGWHGCWGLWCQLWVSSRDRKSVV